MSHNHLHYEGCWQLRHHLTRNREEKRKLKQTMSSDSLIEKGVTMFVEHQYLREILLLPLSNCTQQRNWNLFYTLVTVFLCCIFKVGVLQTTKTVNTNWCLSVFLSSYTVLYKFRVRHWTSQCFLFTGKQDRRIQYKRKRSPFLVFDFGCVYKDREKKREYLL